MTIRDRLRSWEHRPPVRVALMIVGVLLLAVTPLVGPIPGPGGIITFGAGLTLLLRYSRWARRVYVRWKRRWPRPGAWADWSLRRASARRRAELAKGESD